MSSSKASFVLVIFATICLVSEASHAAELPAELYWKARFSNTPIPAVLKYSMPLGANDGSVNYLKKNYGDKSYHRIPSCNVQAFITTYNPDVILPQDGQALFFTDDVFSKPGTKLKFQFRNFDTKIKFLPLNIAKSLQEVSSTSNKLNVIQSMLSVNPSSSLAKDIFKTINKCEEKGVKGEVRFCANSLEAMIDNVITLNSGNNNFKVLSTNVEKNNEVQEFTIKKATKIGNDKKNVVCHKLKNPYAVFLCHSIKNTDIYVVSLIGANGQEIKTMAQCHTDTSSWDPKSIALQFLKIKPGTKPVCHFLDSDSLIWVQN